MRQYDRVNAHKPTNIETRKAYIVGGGIAGLSAAAFLIDDGYMPASNVTIFEQRHQAGGSMDASGNPVDGYVSRGERELEPWMECLWYLFSKVPSLEDPDRTVLDETRECNEQLRINSRYRLTENCFQKRDYSTMGLTSQDKDDMLRLMLTPEDKLDDISIQEWFKPTFFRSNLWYFWSSMLAFQPWHSLIEMKRYMVRFLHHLPGISHLRGILHTKYQQNDSMVIPLVRWLKRQGVNFIYETTVNDLDVRDENGSLTVTAIHLTTGYEVKRIELTDGDLVFITNGSMTQNTTTGSMHTIPKRNDDKSNRGSFTLWEQLAKKNARFGHPEKFVSNNEQTYWISYTLTITDYPELFDYVTRTTGNIPGTGGVITMTDSAWFMSINCPMQPMFPDQPENVQVLWGYGLYAKPHGNYIDKAMDACTGEEICKELLYHMGLKNKMEEIIPHCNLIPTIMPYITSQFMPRAAGDRPKVIPDGSTNLAFMGQYVEIPGDVVFTVETSVRTAMVAIYGLLKLDKPVVPLYEGQYDIRVAVASLKTLLGKEKFSPLDLFSADPIKLPVIFRQLIRGLNDIPEIKEEEVIY
ncbi:MAG: oleate hydratase [Anaerolineae bacterium]